MLIPSSKLVFFFTTSSLISAFPISTNQISQSLQSKVPGCAHSCVQDFLNSEFPLACTTSSDVDCLCSQYSKSGFTLGEGIYRCALADCPKETSSDSTSFYGVCLAQKNAVLPTHATLTVTQSNKPTNTVSKASGTQSSQISAQAASTTTPSSRSKPTQTTFRTVASSLSNKPTTSTPGPSHVRPSPSSQDPFSSGSTTASSSTGTPLRSSHFADSTSPQTTPTPPSTGGLNLQQIIGICVAGGAAVVLAIGAIVLLSFRRKRVMNQQVEEKPRLVDSLLVTSPEPPFPPPKNGLKDPRGGNGGVGIGVPPYKRRNVPPLETQPSWEKKGLKIEDIGVAISPEADNGTSPLSMSSTRTLSRLLPDKPNSAHVEPLRVQRPESSMTLFEEERQGVNFTPVFSPTAPHPPLTLNIPMPPMPQQVWYAGQANQMPIYPPRTASSTYSRAASSYMAPPSRPVTEIENDDYIPPYYTRSRDNAANRKSGGRVKARHHPTWRDSAASMTSFESVDQDDPTPPEEEDKQLSPVPESPLQSLRYPKVPRSANQAVPRSPTSPKRIANQPPTLLSKRRGDDTAHQLERTLWITDSNSSSIKSGKESHSRGHSRGSSFANQPSSQSGVEANGLRSPWAPKITPSRRGHDLFLSVT